MTSYDVISQILVPALGSLSLGAVIGWLTRAFLWRFDEFNWQILSGVVGVVSGGALSAVALVVLKADARMFFAYFLGLGVGFLWYRYDAIRAIQFQEQMNRERQEAWYRASFYGYRYPYPMYFVPQQSHPVNTETVGDKDGSLAEAAQSSEQPKDTEGREKKQGSSDATLEAQKSQNSPVAKASIEQPNEPISQRQPFYSPEPTLPYFPQPYPPPYQPFYQPTPLAPNQPFYSPPNTPLMPNSPLGAPNYPPPQYIPGQTYFPGNAPLPDIGFHLGQGGYIQNSNLLSNNNLDPFKNTMSSPQTTNWRNQTK
jgi:hypothetical protein